MFLSIIWALDNLGRFWALTTWRTSLVWFASFYDLDVFGRSYRFFCCECLESVLSKNRNLNLLFIQFPSGVRRWIQSDLQNPGSMIKIRFQFPKYSKKYPVFLSRSLKSGSSQSASHPCIEAPTHFLDGFYTFWRREKTPRRWWNFWNHVFPFPYQNRCAIQTIRIPYSLDLMSFNWLKS